MVKAQTMSGRYQCPTLVSCLPVNDNDFDLVQERLARGDSSVSEVLYLRFAQQLVELSQHRIARRFHSRFDGEDIVQTVFRTFIRRCQDNTWEFDDWNDLWKFLVRITICKCASKARRHDQQSRNASQDRTLTEGAEPASTEPTADEVAIFNDLLTYLLEQLEESRRPVIRCALMGYTLRESAERAGCSVRTVNRVMAQAKLILNEYRQAPSAAQ